MAFTVACPHCFAPNRFPGPLRQRKALCSVCRQPFTTEEGLLYRVRRLGGRRKLLGWLIGLLLLAALGLAAWKLYPVLVAPVPSSETPKP